jgi:hypothetical protein
MAWGLRSKHPLAGYVLDGPCDEGCSSPGPRVSLCRSNTADTFLA